MGALKRVLLVEDNEQDEILTIKAFNRSAVGLKNQPCAIEVLRDGEKALGFFTDPAQKKNERRPYDLDLILLDLNLPKVSGFEVLKEIRKLPDTNAIPVVILSTSTDPIDIKRSYELGANSFIKKPVDFEEFTQLVVVLKDYWFNKNQTNHL